MEKMGLSPWVLSHCGHVTASLGLQLQLLFAALGPLRWDSGAQIYFLPRAFVWKDSGLLSCPDCCCCPAVPSVCLPGEGVLPPSAVSQKTQGTHPHYLLVNIYTVLDILLNILHVLSHLILKKLFERGNTVIVILRWRNWGTRRLKNFQSSQ